MSVLLCFYQQAATEKPNANEYQIQFQMKDFKFNFDKQLQKSLKNRVQPSIRRRIRSVQHAAQSIIDSQSKRLHLALTIQKFMIILLIGLIVGVYYLAIEGKDTNSTYFQTGIYIVAFTGLLIFLLWISSIAIWQTTLSFLQKEIQIMLIKESNYLPIQWKFNHAAFSVVLTLSDDAFRKPEVYTLPTNIESGNLIGKEVVKPRGSQKGKEQLKLVKKGSNSDDEEEEDEEEDIENKPRKGSNKMISNQSNEITFTPIGLTKSKSNGVSRGDTPMHNQIEPTSYVLNTENSFIEKTMEMQKLSFKKQSNNTSEIKVLSLKNSDDDEDYLRDQDDDGTSQISNLPQSKPKNMQPMSQFALAAKNKQDNHQNGAAAVDRSNSKSNTKDAESTPVTNRIISPLQSNQEDQEEQIDIQSNQNNQRDVPILPLIRFDSFQSSSEQQVFSKNRNQQTNGEDERQSEADQVSLNQDKESYANDHMISLDQN